MPTKPKGEDAVEMVNVGTIEVEVAIDQALTVRFGMVEVELLVYVMVPASKVTVSPMASPRVVAFSTVRLEIVVAPTLTEPEVVSDLANTSPSASTKKIESSFTPIPRMPVSATADAGFKSRVELKREEVATPGLQTEKVWATVGTLVRVKRPVTVEVAMPETVSVPSMATSEEKEADVPERALEVVSVMSLGMSSSSSPETFETVAL